MNRSNVWRGLRLSFAFLPVFSVLACNFLGSWGATGRLRVLVTDSPFPVDMIERAEITITRVEARLTTQSAESQPADEEGTTEDGEWIVVFEGETTLDLLDLRNGRTDLLADATIPAGHYTELRLIVTGGTVKLIDDDRIFDLRVPSGEQTGIKLKLAFDVPEDGEATLLLDVDLSRAFMAMPPGHSDDPASIRSFRFQPAIAMRLINIVEAGQISGVVTDAGTQLPIENAQVAASRDGSEVGSTFTDPDGTYTLMGLAAGTYSVEFSAIGYQSHTEAAVDVQAGQTTTQNAALTTQPE